VVGDGLSSVSMSQLENRRNDLKKETTDMASLATPADLSAPSASTGTSGDKGSGVGSNKRKYIAMVHEVNEKCA
jgi:hypothetical protein